MICERCHGTGKRVHRSVGLRCRVKTVSLEPCPDCGGCGFTHCCEGDQAQPGEYDREADSFASWAEAIAELRRRHLAGEPVSELPLFRSNNQPTGSGNG